MRAPAVGLLVLALDQVSKAAAHTVTACTELFCPLRNDELLFGLSPGSRSLVLAWSIAGLLLFYAWVRVASRRCTVPTIPIALVVAGVTGNLIDRLTLGYVRDFLGLPGTIVNVADLALALGMLLAAATILYRSARSSTVDRTVAVTLNSKRPPITPSMPSLTPDP